MNGITKDVAVDPSFGAFEELLWEWTSIIERMVRGWRKKTHVPWWYNERASLSSFAGAIWRTGGIAFEEFSAKRKTPMPDGGGDTERWQGRIDLQFSYQGSDFVAEAKQAWPRIGRRSKSAVGDIEDALQQAGKEAQTIVKNWGDRLAIVFAAPLFPESEIANERKLLKNWRDVVEQVKCDGSAFFWLHNCQQIIDDGEVYPGAGIFIQRV